MGLYLRARVPKLGPACSAGTWYSFRALFELTGKRAIVTGSSEGIGRATALALARAGANVGGIYKTARTSADAAVDEIRSLGREAFMVEGDTGNADQVEALLDRAVTLWGGLDVWVNNAARLLVKPLLETTDGDWHGLLAANLHGYFYACRAAGRQMVGQGGGGRIVNVTSVSDVQRSPSSAPMSLRRARSSV